MRSIAIIVALAAACGSTTSPPRSAPAPAPAPARPDASSPAAPPPAISTNACPDDAGCAAPCVAIDGRVVDPPPVAVAHHKRDISDEFKTPYDIYTIYYFDHGDADCERRDYDSLVSVSTSIPSGLSTISWGGMFTGGVGDLQILDAGGDRLALCASRKVLHMEGQPTIVVQGLFSATLCPMADEP